MHLERFNTSSYAGLSKPIFEVIMKTRYIIALALLSILLISSKIALADSAWVLWLEDSHYSAPGSQTWGPQTNKWNIVDTSSSGTECRQKIQEKIINCILNTENLLKKRNVIVSLVTL